ncbi:hypothetical protein Tco_0541178 [Tanacetum coccineum]
MLELLTSHEGTMAVSLRHQWRDTIFGSGAYGCILEVTSGLFLFCSIKEKTEGNCYDVLRNNSRSIDGDSEADVKWVKQDKPNVYITLTSLTGTKGLQRACGRPEIINFRNNDDMNKHQHLLAGEHSGGHTSSAHSQAFATDHPVTPISCKRNNLLTVSTARSRYTMSTRECHYNVIIASRLIM